MLRTLSAIALGALALVAPAAAEQFRTIGDYEIHYNAFNADTVPPEVAAAHGITRSRSRAVINVTVLRKGADGTTAPSQAEVSAKVANLAGQSQSVPMREAKEATAIYYLGQFRIAGEDTYRITLQVKPAGAARAETIVFSQPLVGE